MIAVAIVLAVCGQPADLSSVAQAQLHQIMLSIDKGVAQDGDQSETVLALEAQANAILEKPDRDIWTFGDGRKGQLGHPTRDIVTRPRMIHYLDYTVITRMACGQEHMVAVSDTNNTYTWGSGRFGQLSDIVVDDQLKPHWSIGLRETRVQNVFAGGWTSMCIDDKQEAYSWGWAAYGQLGRKSKEQPKPGRIEAPLIGKKIAHIAIGLVHALVVTDKGDVYGFGASMYGQVGNGALDNLQLPVQLKALRGEKVLKVAAGCEHSMALTESGDVWSWGNGVMGQLGHGNWKSEKAPRRIAQMKRMGKSIMIAAGCHHSFAVLENNVLLGWGWNRWGQLGVGDTLNRPTPRAVDYFRGQMPIRSISAGRRHTLLLSSTMRVFCWGNNQFGQCGKPHPAYIKSPVVIDFFDSMGIRQICANGDYSAALSDTLWADGRVSNSTMDDELVGKSREHARVSKMALQQLIQADKLAEEWAVDRDPSISVNDKAEAKFQADVRVAKIHGVPVSELLGKNSPDMSAAPFVLPNPVDPVTSSLDPSFALQTKQEEPNQGDDGSMDEIENAAKKAAQDQTPPVPQPKLGSGTLGEDSRVNRDPPSLDELKSMGPIASEQLDGEEILPPPAMSLPPDAPPPLITSPHITWFEISIYNDNHCDPESVVGTTWKGKNQEICRTAATSSSVHIVPSSQTAGLFDVEVHQNLDCKGAELMSFDAICGEECVSHPVASVVQFWTIRCGYSVHRTNNTVSGIARVEEFYRARAAAALPAKQPASPIPFRNCDPAASGDLDCHTTEVDRLWDEVHSRLSPSSERKVKTAPEHLTWANVSLYSQRDTKVVMDPFIDGENTTVSKSEGRGTFGGGVMEFDLMERRDKPVRVSGVIYPTIIENGGLQRGKKVPLIDSEDEVASASPDQFAGSKNSSKPVPVVQYPPPPSLDGKILFPKPNPLSQDIKGPAIIEALQIAQGAAEHSDDFDAFFE